MPPTKDYNSKHQFGRSFSSNETSMNAKVYHHATNLMPSSPPLSPTGMAPPFPNTRGNGQSWGRPTSHNGGRYS